MAKRFADTDLWDKQWFMDLTCKHKCLVQFLFAKCDAAGVWSANYGLASSFIGEKIGPEDMKAIESRVRLIAPGKYFIVDFIDFQYGKLSAACKPHVKVLELLIKHGIDSKGYGKGIHTLQEKEEDKDKETVKEKGVQGETEVPEVAEAALGHEMSQAFMEINPKYPASTSHDMPAIVQIANFIHTQGGGKPKPMGEMDVGERRAVMREWRKWCDWYRDNGVSKSLDFLVRFRLQEIYSETKNGKNGTDKRAIEKHTTGKNVGALQAIDLLAANLKSRGG